MNLQSIVSGPHGPSGSICRVILRLARTTRRLRGAEMSRSGSCASHTRAGFLCGSARPILFLNLLCLIAGIPLAMVSATLGLVFISAGAGAFGLFLWMAVAPPQG